MRTQLQNFGGDDPIWSFVAQLRTERYTGSAHVGANPRLRLFVAGGRVYFAEREGDPALGTRLVNFGVLTATQLERGAVHVGDVVSLARLFHRDPTIDQDAVELTIEMATEKLLETMAQQPVRVVELFPLRHHPSGIHLWTRDEPQRVFEPAPAVEAAVEPSAAAPVETPPAVEPAADEPVDEPAAEPAAESVEIEAPEDDETVVEEPVTHTAHAGSPATEPAIHLAAAPTSFESVAEVPAEPVFQPASLSIPSLRAEPVAEPTPEPVEAVTEPTTVALPEFAGATEDAADEPMDPQPAEQPEPAATPSLLSVLRAEEPRPEPRRDSAASLLAALRDEPSPSETITAVVPVVPSEPVVAEPVVAEPQSEAHEPAPATVTHSGLTSLSALAPLTATPPPAEPAPLTPDVTPDVAGPAAAGAALASLPSTPDLAAPAGDAATPVPSAGLPHLAAAPTAVPRREHLQDSMPHIPADANLPRLGSPGSAAVPATAAAPHPAEATPVPDLATWTPAAQNMAAVQIWEMVDELTVPDVQPLLVPSGAGDDRKSRGWRKGRKG